MAGLVPAIHVLLSCSEKDVDARNECGHDELSERVVLVMAGTSPAMTATTTLIAQFLRVDFGWGEAPLNI
jgi:hypothetical protein